MSQTPAITTALAAGAQPEDVLTKEEYAKLVAQAEKATPESINAMTVNPPPIQSAQLVAKHTFASFFKLLEALRVAYGEAPIDCSTTAGEEAARKIWRKLVTLRTRADKVRLDQSRFFIEHRDANNDEYKMLEDTVRPLEKRYEDAVREREREQEAARKKRDDEAQARAENITKFILGISAHADNLIGLTSAELATRIQEVTLIEIVEPDLDHRFGEAVTIKDRTIARLEAARAEKEEAEKNAAQVAADRERYAAEKEAREAIDRINTMLAAAGGKTTDQLEDDIEGLAGIIFEQYQPLEEEARAAVDRALPVLRQTLADKLAAAEKMKRDLEASAKAEKEATARNGIASMKAMVADCVGASSAAIAATIDRLNGLLMASFEPFAKEAEEEQARVLTSLEKLRVAAASEEATIEAKRLKEKRDGEISSAIAELEGTARRAELSAMPSKTIRETISSLNDPDNFTVETYGDRRQEALDIAGDQAEALGFLFDAVFEAEERAAKKKAEDELAAQAEAKEKARRTRLEDAMHEHCFDMHTVLQAVRGDIGFELLEEGTRTKVEALLETIRAQVGG